MSSITKALYACAQKDLYSVCRTGWRNYLNNAAPFAGFKALYIDAIATDALAAVDAAEALPDLAARMENEETLHVQLEKDGKTCCKNFQKYVW